MKRIAHLLCLVLALCLFSCQGPATPPSLPQTTQPQGVDMLAVDLTDMDWYSFFVQMDYGIREEGFFYDPNNDDDLFLGRSGWECAQRIIQTFDRIGTEYPQALTDKMIPAQQLAALGYPLWVSNRAKVADKDPNLYRFGPDTTYSLGDMYARAHTKLYSIEKGGENYARLTALLNELSQTVYRQDDLPEDLYKPSFTGQTALDADGRAYREVYYEGMLYVYLNGTLRYVVLPAQEHILILSGSAPETLAAQLTKRSTAKAAKEEILRTVFDPNTNIPSTPPPTTKQPSVPASSSQEPGVPTSTTG